MSGFIDPGAHDRRRLDRLEVLLDELLRHVGVNALSPEAQEIHRDLTSSDARRIHRARMRLQADMARDPIDTEPSEPTACGRDAGSRPYWMSPGQYNACPVRLACLDAAMRAESGMSRQMRFGMYGGLTPGERSQLDQVKPTPGRVREVRTVA